MRANQRLAWVTAVFALCFAERVGQAGPVGPLTTFTSGTPALASEVNGNFSAVKTAVDDNAARIGTLETRVTPAGNIELVPSTAVAGNILKGGVRFIHNFGSGNTFVGLNAGNLTMAGGSNTAAGQSALTNNTSGNNNTAVGITALRDNTTGNFNTATGMQALQRNTTGNDNTATGGSALFSNTTGFGNTATGVQALQNNTTGNLNTAHGRAALVANTIGVGNTATGDSTLPNNTTGDSNTANGAAALFSNTTGLGNTASGVSALTSNTIGNSNTASGMNSLRMNTTGSGNIAIGNSAGFNLTTGDNNIAIGNTGVAAEANTIRIGAVQTRAFIAGIRGVTTGAADTVTVVVDSAGQLGTVNSSRRVKEHIADMGKASEALMKLRPVTFYYKTGRKPEVRTLQYGLIAEEVEEVAPGLVVRSADGKVETVYYQFLAPMLLNEVQKQQRTISAQAARLAEQTARIAELERDREKQLAEIAELKRQTARIEALETQARHTALLIGRLEQAGMLAAAGQ